MKKMMYFCAAIALLSLASCSNSCNNTTTTTSPSFDEVLTSRRSVRSYDASKKISAFIFALCMAILYLKTDNILVPIFAHILNNFLAESIVIIDTQHILFNNTVVMGAMSLLAIISMFLIVGSIIKELNSIK